MGASSLSSRAIIGSFYHRLAQLTGASWVSQLAMMFTSDQESETYKWLGQVPQMREWIGGRQAKGFRENGITISNKDYEATLEVLTKDLRRDKTGQILIRVAELARRTLSHDAKLITTLIEGGSSGVCYDGQYFFDTDHSEGDSGTQDNDLTTSIVLKTAPPVAEMVTAIYAMISKIIGYKDDQGEPMNEEALKFIIMVPVAGTFLSAAQSAVADTTIVSGSASRTNELASAIAKGKFSVDVVANPRLTWTDTFAMFRTDADVKPFIIQLEQPVTLDAIAEGSELEFKEKKHWYGVSKSGNVGYGYWQHGCLQTFTTT